MVASSCFGVTLPSSGSIPSTFWEMLNWGAVERILWMGMLCLVTWCLQVSRVTVWIWEVNFSPKNEIYAPQTLIYIYILVLDKKQTYLIHTNMTSICRCYLFWITPTKYAYTRWDLIPHSETLWIFKSIWMAITVYLCLCTGEFH
jgi:hypothetical protein